MIEFTNFVGTSPGTTTMEIPAMNGLGVCPPGYYGQNIMLPGTAIQMTAPTQAQAPVNPYATESRLSGLRGSAIRWDLTLLAFGAAFAGVLVYMAKRKRA
jgi:hypothetical protein